METIELATEHDLPGLIDLLEVLFEQESDFQPNRDKQERGLRLILDWPEMGAIFVARDADEQVVGMVSLLYSISTAEGGRVCWLEDMVVHPDHRSGGLGTRLLNHALKCADRGDFVRVTLLTDGNNEGAKRFYGRHGFVESNMSVLRRKPEGK